jgi:N-acetylgalactosamine kinase
VREFAAAGTESAATGHRDKFFIKQRLLHVLNEAKRVGTFRALCTDTSSISSSSSSSAAEAAQGESKQQQQQPPQQQDGDVASQLGAILNAGHASCAKLYDCSCPELNLLQQACLDSGALGARLTGAGWGGAIVALVREGADAAATAAAFFASLQSKYYAKHALHSVPTAPHSAKLARGDIMFASKPANGSGVLVLNSSKQ